MLTTLLMIVTGAVAYLNIGYWWGRLSWKAWHKKKRSFAGLLCFPASYAFNEIDNRDKRSFPEPILVGCFMKEDKYETAYAKTIGFIWPLKLTFNSIVFALMVVLKPIYNLPQLVSQPFRLLSRMAKRAPKQLPPPPPEPSQFNIDEYDRLLEQKTKIDARLKELEAHPDKKKIILLPRRF